MSQSSFSYMRLFVLFLLVAIGVIPGFSYANSENIIRVGYPLGNMLPYSKAEQNQVEGLLPSLFDNIAKESGYTIENKVYNSIEDVMAAFQLGELDAIIGVSDNAQRQKKMLLSEVILSTRRVAIANSEIQNYTDLNSKKLAIIAGASDNMLIDTSFSGVEKLLRSTTKQAIESIVSRQADAQVGDGLLLYSAWRQSGYDKKLKLSLMDDLPVNNLYIGVQKNNPDLLNKLNVAIDNLQKNTERSKILNKWLDETQLRFLLVQSYDLALTEVEQQWLDESPVIKVGIEKSWGPIESITQSGEYIGVAADVLKEIARLTGIHFEYVQHSSYEATYQAFIRGEIDMLSAISINEQRQTKMNFTQPFMQEPWVFLGRSANSAMHIKEFIAFSNVKFGVVASTYGESEVASVCSHCEVKKYSDIDSALKALADREVDAVSASLLIASPHIQEEYLGQIKVISNLSFAHVSFAVNKEQQLLLNILNKALSSIPPSQMRETKRRWITSSYQNGELSSDMLLIIVLGAIGASIILIAVIAWNWRLKKEIAQRIKVESELHEAEQHMQYLADNVSGAVIQHAQSDEDLDEFKFTFISAGIFQLIGMRAEYLMEVPKSIFDVVDKTEKERIMKAMNAALKKGRLHEEIRINFQGRPKWIQLQSNITNKGDGFFYWNSVLTDITPLKENQEELNSAHLKAVAATEAKSRFLANMSHEIRTPISAIKGLLELMESYPLSHDVQKLHTSLSQSTRNLLHIVNDILDFSKIEAGKLGIALKETELLGFIAKIVQPQAIHAHSKGLSFEVWCDPAIASVGIIDETRLSQVLNNLINNAIKFTDFGKIELRVDCVHTKHNRQMLCFSIIDTGIGISEDKLAELFQPFEQLDLSTSRKFGGTGLGLAISHQLSQLMGGKISCVSQLGQGSSFRALLPVDVHTEASLPSFENKSCLLIAENMPQQEELTAYLEQWGMNLHHRSVKTKAEMGKLAVSSECQYLVIFQEDYQRLGVSVEWLKQKLPMIKVVLLTKEAQLSPEPYDQHWCISVNPLLPNHLDHALSEKVELFDEVEEEAVSLREPIQGRVQAEAAGRLILVAEDHPINQQVIGAQLRRLGFHADIVDNGAEALQRLKETQEYRYGLLLTDCHMPEMDGYELTKQVREREMAEDLPRLPIIALTANAIEGEDQKCIDLGMDHFLTKPVEMSILNKLLTDWLPDINGNNQKVIETNKEEAVLVPSAILPYEQEAESQGIYDFIDYDEVMAMFGDKDVVEHVVREFIVSHDTGFKTLLTAVEHEQHREITDISHQMKGAAAMMTCTVLSSPLNELELAAQVNDSHRYAPLIQTLKNITEQLNKFV